MKSVLLLSVIALFGGAALSLTLTPPENQWVRVGHKVHLVCRSSDPIATCTWVTPYGKSYTLESGLVAERGRLRHHGEDPKTCGLEVANVTAADDGVWACSVGVVQNSELTSATGQATVSIAKRPESIELGEPFNLGAFNVSLDDGERSVRCVVRGARPKPLFSWFVGEEALTGAATTDESNGTTYTQTLKYTPQADHANQTLRCVVDHEGLDEEDEREAGVLLRLTKVAEDFVADLHSGSPSSSYILTIFLFVVVALVVGFSALVAVFKVGRHLRDKKGRSDSSTRTASGGDEESPKDDKGDDAAADAAEEEKKTEEDGEVAETVPKTAGAKERRMKERFSSFFTFKKDSGKGAEQEEAKTDEDFVAVDVDDKEETTKAAEDLEQTKKGSRFGAFLEFFRLRHSGKKTEEMAMDVQGEEESGEEKRKKDEEEKEKVEYEPEEKEPKEDEARKIEDVEKKEQPKNTDV